MQKQIVTCGHRRCWVPRYGDWSCRTFTAYQKNGVGWRKRV